MPPEIPQREVGKTSASGSRLPRLQRLKYADHRRMVQRIAAIDGAHHHIQPTDGGVLLVHWVRCEDGPGAIPQPAISNTKIELPFFLHPRRMRNGYHRYIADKNLRPGSRLLVDPSPFEGPALQDMCIAGIRERRKGPVGVIGVVSLSPHSGDHRRRPEKPVKFPLPCSAHPATARTKACWRHSGYLTVSSGTSPQGRTVVLHTRLLHRQSVAMARAAGTLTG